MKIILSVTLALILIGCSNESASSAKEEIVKSVENVTEVVKKESIDVVQNSTVKLETTVEPELGATLFAKCASCHGQNAEKKALNKSLVIKGWSVAKTIASINGYKDGTYGSTMKAIMKPQVVNLSKDEVQALAKYISNL